MERKPSREPMTDGDELPEDDVVLTISPASVIYLIAKAKQIAVKDVVTEPDPASNPSDDHLVGIVEDPSEDTVDEDMLRYIEELSEDEQIDLVALAWLGRDDFAAEEWPEVREQAVDAHNDRTANYLLGMPLLANYLEAGLATLGYPVEELESDLLS